MIRTVTIELTQKCFEKHRGGLAVEGLTSFVWLHVVQEAVGVWC